MRVATYNVYLGCDLSLVFGVTDDAELAQRIALMRRQLDATDFAARGAAIARILVREHVDVVGLQEVATWTRTTDTGEPAVFQDFLALLLDALRDAGSPYDPCAVNTNFEGGAAVSDGGSMAVRGTNVTLVRRDSGISVVGEQVGGYTAAMHLETGEAGITIDARRSWGAADCVVDGRTVRIVNTHTEAWDLAARNGQRDQLVAAVGDPGIPVVIVGDFNSRPEDIGMPSVYRDAWTAGTGAGFTYGQGAELDNEESGMRERIDYIFVRDAAVRAAWVVGDQQSDRTTGARLWPSDHACVIADVDL